MDDVSKRLNLVNAIGVSNGEQLQQTIVDDGLIAGIEFHHPHVSQLKEAVKLPVLFHSIQNDSFKSKSRI